MPDSNFTQSDTDQLAQSQPLQTQPQDTPQAPAPPIPTNGAGVNAVAGMPTATPTQAPTPTVKPHPVADMFNKILTSAVGGPMSTVDENGVRRPAPQSNVSLGKILTASLLAGIFSKDEYRQTAYGPVRDYSGTGANAVAASQGVIRAAQARPQQQFDEQKARQQAGRLLTLENNSKLVALQTASANLKHSYQTQNAAAVETALGPFKEYESSRTADQPKAWIDGGQNLTHVQAMDMIKQKGNGYTENNILQDGWTSKWNDATKQSEPEPTYGILSSELKDIKLSDEATQLLARVHSQWANAQKVTDGNVRVPVNVYVSALHDVQAVMQGAETLNQLSTELGGKGVTQADVEAAARNGRDKGANILPALYNLSHAVAGGNLPDQRADNLLHTLMTAPNGQDILKLIGLTPEQASEKAEAINNERQRQAKLAAEGGIGTKAPASPDKVAAALGTVNSLPKDQQASFKARLIGTPTNAEVDSVDKDARSQFNENRTANLAAQKESEKNMGDEILTTPDALGYTPKNYGGSLKEYNKRQAALKKNVDETSKMEGTYQQFQSTLNDINAGKDITGAASVVALFNAIGISATPLAGKGFRINQNTVKEHEEARGLGQSLYQKLLGLQTGAVITPQQIKDYAQIAADTRTNQYVNFVNQAHGQGLNADFILPTGNGAKMDANTAKVFLKLTGGNLDAAKKAAAAKGWQ